MQQPEPYGPYKEQPHMVRFRGGVGPLFTLGGGRGLVGTSGPSHHSKALAAGGGEGHLGKSLTCSLPKL